MPDELIRQSLLFVLGTEGYSIVFFDQLAETTSDPQADAGYDCAIVDEDAIGSLPGGWDRLRATGLPLVLLVDRLEDSAMGGVRSVRKPLLGSALIDAVLCSLCEGRRRATGATT